MRELDLGIASRPSLSFGLLMRAVDKGIITKEGAARLWTEEEIINVPKHS